jgi:hypothetical protein
VTIASFEPTSWFNSVDFPALQAQPLQQRGGGGGFSGALRRGRGRRFLLSRDADRHREMPGMVRPLDRGQSIIRQAKAAALRPFLQQRLGISRRCMHRGDYWRPETLHKGERRGKAGIEIDRRDQRLARIGEDPRLFCGARGAFGWRELHITVETHRGGDLGQRVAAHKLREAAGQIAFRLGGVLPPQEIGDDKPEHPVAKKFEPFVIARPAGAACALCAAAVAALRQHARMGQRLGEQLGIGKGMPDPPLQLLRRRACRGRVRRNRIRAQLTPRNSRL